MLLHNGNHHNDDDGIFLKVEYKQFGRVILSSSRDDRSTLIQPTTQIISSTRMMQTYLPEGGDQRFHDKYKGRFHEVFVLLPK